MDKQYGITGLYRSRNKYVHYNDLSLEDEWQLEVYLHALGLLKRHNLRSIVDIGCGSAYKLLTYFDDYETIGLELPVNVQVLKERYPNKQWQISDFTTNPSITTDVVICSDVIEHLVDPDELLAFIKRISYHYLVVSTPDRSLIYRPWQRGYWGPPNNKAHQREWNFDEFYKYLSAHFDVIDHRVTNLQQWTQMAICKPK
ncbi:MAG: hypothetical protein NPIRA04_31820 [Nitrospirales bacterium]|nr:MAG: hypothetical protein NPIRA04_31820 [Nitrospirales bacterium]